MTVSFWKLQFNYIRISKHYIMCGTTKLREEKSVERKYWDSQSGNVADIRGKQNVVAKLAEIGTRGKGANVYVCLFCLFMLSCLCCGGTRFTWILLVYFYDIFFVLIHYYYYYRQKQYVTSPGVFMFVRNISARVNNEK